MKTILFSLLTVISFTTFAKNPLVGITKYYYPIKLEDDGERFIDRLRFGGNVGLQIGNPTNILISPSVGYLLPGKFFDDRVILGVGATYMYYRLRLYNVNYSSNIYGGRVYTVVYITPNLFAYLEDEFLNAPVYDINANATRQWINSVFLGGGYMIPLGDRGGVMISILYNLSWTAIHPLYGSPWNVRVGFVF